MVFNPIRKSSNNRKKKRKKIDSSFKIITVILTVVTIWAIFLTIRSVVNYREILKVYEAKKAEYELLEKKLESKEKELEILRRALKEYGPIRGNNILQTQPSTDTDGKENSE